MKFQSRNDVAQMLHHALSSQIQVHHRNRYNLFVMQEVGRKLYDGNGVVSMKAMDANSDFERVEFRRTYFVPYVEDDPF